ncbi:MAG TPA: 4Fe-4S dicluster domain-containing protein, partial [Symbiobacteriaceae bacterium]|nr:4Fe-4S dicluster domain-containing protein [Symbiobacteriaceae bacterium]
VESCLTGALTFGNADLHAATQRQVVTEAPGFPDPSITRPSTRFAWPLKGPRPDHQVSIAPPAADPAHKEGK